MVSIQARFLGCLVGLAVGDAVGTTLEFQSPGTFQPITDMLGGGPFRLQPGQWTDDTSMALCLAESLVQKNSFDPLDQMERYTRWYREGYWSSTGRCFDIGGTVRDALARFKHTRQPYCGSANPNSAGNGSLMRLAPAAMAFARQPATAVARCADSSRTTHAAPTAVDACRYFGSLLAGALNGESKEVLLAARYAPAPDYWQINPLVPEIDEIAAGSFWQRHPPHIKGSGFVVRSLEAALWAFARSEDFRSGCLLAANLGDDADTTAAIYGQIAGAFYGCENIPAEWRTKITRCQEIEKLALQLFELSENLP